MTINDILLGGWQASRRDDEEVGIMDLTDARVMVEAIHRRDCGNPICAIEDQMAKEGDLLISHRHTSANWVYEWTLNGRLYQGRGRTRADALDDVIEKQRANLPVD